MAEKKRERSKSQWPDIKKKNNLQITRIKDMHLFTIQNFFTPGESKAYLNTAESLGFLHQGSLGPARGEAFRDNDRISINDPTLAESIWESGLRKVFANIQVQGKIAVGLNPNIRFYRYKVGQRFGRHIDESVDLGNGCTTFYTLLIYLNGSIKSNGGADSSCGRDLSSVLAGGETVFYNRRGGTVAEVSPMEGMALLHLHGDKCMLHEARAVTKNAKYILRSDVVFACA